MPYHITHITTYRYDRPVTLLPHVVQLRPRSDITQQLHQFTLTVTPEPMRVVEAIALEGNTITTLWFPDQPITHLCLTATATVTTQRHNPFDFLMEPWATQLPIDYPASLLAQLQPYLRGQFGGSLDAIAQQLAQDLWLSTQGNTLSFLSALNQQIYSTCTYMIRETGDALPPGLTWRNQTGSCRDMAVLFIEVCRAIGLAARFVSGYQEGDPDSTQRHLHAWAEVYLPGAGWRGYDPTHGLAVADGHVALVASPVARDTIPVSGAIRPKAQADMSYELSIATVSRETIGLG